MDDTMISRVNVCPRHIKVIFESVLPTMVVSLSAIQVAHSYLDTSDMNVLKREVCKDKNGEQILKEKWGCIS